MSHERQIPGVLFISGQPRPDVRGFNYAAIAVRTMKRLEAIDRNSDSSATDATEVGVLFILGEQRPDIHDAEGVRVALETVAVYKDLTANAL